MKITKLCTLLFISILLSCSVSPELELAGERLPTITSTSSRESPGVYGPENVANIYDEAGWLHNAIFEAYFNGVVKDTSLLTIAYQVNQLANANNHFVRLSAFSYRFDNLQKAKTIVGNPELQLSNTLTSTIQNAEVASEFAQFLTNYEQLCKLEDDYELLYAEVIAFEHSIMENPSVNAHDLEVILTTTSIVRYSTYKRKKRPKKNTDPEWYLLIANMTGAISGAEESMQDAVVLSLITGIAENQ